MRYIHTEIAGSRMLRSYLCSCMLRICAVLAQSLHSLVYYVRYSRCVASTHTTHCTYPLQHVAVGEDMCMYAGS